MSDGIPITNQNLCQAVCKDHIIENGAMIKNEAPTCLCLEEDESMSGLSVDDVGVGVILVVSKCCLAVECMMLGFNPLATPAKCFLSGELLAEESGSGSARGDLSSDDDDSDDVDRNRVLLTIFDVLSDADTR